MNTNNVNWDSLPIRLNSVECMKNFLTNNLKSNDTEFKIPASATFCNGVYAGTNYLVDPIFSDNIIFAQNMYSNATFSNDLNAVCPTSGNNLIDMSYCFKNCKLNGVFVGGPNTINISHAYENAKMGGVSSARNFNFNFDDSKVVDMSYVFSNYARGMVTTSSTVAFGPYTRNMSYAYYNTDIEIGISFPNNGAVVDGSHAFDTSSFVFVRNINNAIIDNASHIFNNCSRLQNIDSLNFAKMNNLSNAFHNCPYMTSQSGGEPLVIGDSTENMSGMFFNCKTLSASSISIGSNVTDMSNAFPMCYLLNTSPVCGINVVNMRNAYSSCDNITGDAASGPKVVDMTSAYRLCKKLNGSAACGNNVTSLNNAYSDTNIRNAVCGPNVIDMSHAYENCMFVTNPACGPNVTNMCSAYSNCANVAFAVCGNSVLDMSNAFRYTPSKSAKGTSLITTPVCGPNVINMAFAYHNCSSMVGNPVCGNNVVNFHYTYAYCDLTDGVAVCGPNVTDMAGAYGWTMLNGHGVCGNNVINMCNAYADTYITSADVGPNVNDASGTFTYTDLMTVNLYSLPESHKFMFDMTDMLADVYIETDITGNRFTMLTNILNTRTESGPGYGCKTTNVYVDNVEALPFNNYVSEAGLTFVFMNKI